MTSQLDLVKQTYAFQTWKGRNGLDHGLLVKGFFVSSWQVPSWNVLRQVAAPPGATRQSTAYLSDEPKRTERGMTVSVFECPSRAAAHEQLIERLGDFQGPTLAVEQGKLGDVSVAVPGDNLVMFARANLVIVVRRAERDPVPVRDTARRLDELFTAVDLPASSGKVLPELRSVRVTTPGAAGQARVEIDAADPLDRPIWLRLTAQGDLWMDDKAQILFRAGSPTDSVNVIAFNENGGASKASTGLSPAP